MRKVIDCRKMPGSTCTVAIAGTEEEVIPLAMHHAITVHGYTAGPELEQEIRKGLEDEKMPL